MKNFKKFMKEANDFKSFRDLREAPNQQEAKGLNSLKPAGDKKESVWKDSKKFMKEAVRVKKEKYDWGELVVVTDGNSETYPLHPDEQKKIGKLKDGESVSFKDEQGNYVTVRRDGKDAYLTHERTNKKTKVKFKDISK